MEYNDAEVNWPDEAVYQAVYKETFTVPLDLVGLAIGTEGANINKSRQIKGVVDVQKKKKAGGYSFTVFGESPEAIKKARSVLELRQEDYTIPKHLAGQVIGKFGQAIEGVINKSLVNRISVQDENDDVIFNIIGPPEAIENAKFLLNNKLEEILNTDESFFTETFMVPLDLIGLSIGTKGDNIKKSKRISGVFSVKYENQQDSCRFRILGETLEAVKKARSILELGQHAYRVPKHYIAGPVIGKFEQAIEEVLNETIIRTITKHKKKDDVILTIIGPPEAIDYAKCLLKYKLDKTKSINFKRKDEYSRKETDINKTAEKDGYSSEENDGYRTDESDGYSIRTVKKDGYRTEEKNWYKTEEKDEYSTVENEVYSTLENERCNTIEKEGYMTGEIDEYRTAVQDGFRTEEKDEYYTEDNAEYRTKETDGCNTVETGAYSTVEKEIDLSRKDRNRGKEDSESTFIEEQMPRSQEGQNSLCSESDLRSRQPTYTNLPMHTVDSAVQSDPSFALLTQCEVKTSCSKNKKRKVKVKNKFVETDHGQTKLTKAKMQDNCLGKYIEAAIQVKGLNAGLNYDTRPACDDNKGTCISLDSRDISNLKEEISVEKCNGNEINRTDKEQSFESHNIKDSWEMWDSDEEPSFSTELE
ncbi:uncharacterized protein [Mytilus edulis]|uniref:uncharacterized protein n=1 Tax=Mytilus edulis TaxID=6550 RepID=UPI0039F000E6